MKALSVWIKMRFKESTRIRLGSTFLKQIKNLESN